ncbi:MAG: tRNA pseudouridine(13) synthase TruD [Myxococcales bacterium]|nr:tRNA pseudouridine(13) synthase TruD [Myxococcales bacterium]
MPVALPFRTRDFPAMSARFKQRNADFVVVEIPAYDFSGSGDHLYFEIEKDGLTTHQAVQQIARALQVPPRAIGYAGLKDAHAVTRQFFSIEHMPAERVQALSLPGMTVRTVTRHRNKLKVGHLQGNRFVIRLRDVDVSALPAVQAVLNALAASGCPNYFGAQRFGHRHDTWQVGEAILRNDFHTAVAVMAGRPDERDREAAHAARGLFSQGKYREAASAWPRGMGDAAALCRAMARTPDDPRRALLTLNKRLLGLFVSAFQSHLFNRVVAHRIDGLDKVEVGDVAWKHDKGVVFSVEDAAAEAARAQSGEISPSGPMYGARMKLASGRPGELEASLLAEAGLTIDDFPTSGPFQCAGGRRPLRFFPQRCAAQEGGDAHGPFIEVAFDLPSGCYATVVLQEIFKEGLQEG